MCDSESDFVQQMWEDRSHFNHLWRKSSKRIDIRTERNKNLCFERNDGSRPVRMMRLSLVPRRSTIHQGQVGKGFCLEEVNSLHQNCRSRWQSSPAIIAAPPSSTLLRGGSWETCRRQTQSIRNREIIGDVCGISSAGGLIYMYSTPLRVQNSWWNK